MFPLRLQLELNIRLAKPLRMWLAEYVTIEGKAIGSLVMDFGDAMCEACKCDATPDGDVNIWDFVATVDGEALEAIIKASGKKRPVWKKLLLRLHYELHFPLNVAQKKTIKVAVPEGVPPGGGAAK
jgi:hypothetical protein